MNHLFYPNTRSQGLDSMNWTDEQIHKLKLLYEPFGPRLCAEQVGKSELAVRVKACRLRKEKRYAEVIQERMKQNHVKQFQLTIGE